MGKDEQKLSTEITTLYSYFHSFFQGHVQKSFWVGYWKKRESFLPYPVNFYPHFKNVRNTIIVADAKFLRGQKILIPLIFYFLKITPLSEDVIIQIIFAVIYLMFPLKSVPLNFYIRCQILKFENKYIIRCFPFKYLQIFFLVFFVFDSPIIYNYTQKTLIGLWWNNKFKSDITFSVSCIKFDLPSFT